MATNSRLSRRSLLRGGAAVAGALAAARVPGVRNWIGEARAQVVPEQPTVVVIHLMGGYNALFCSADSFLTDGTFGVNSGNVMSLGNGLYVDNSFGNLPQLALNSMATIGVDHGITSHDSANNALWSDDNGQSYAVQLASAMGGSAALKCVSVGQDGVPGPAPSMGSVSLQQVTDMASTIAALGGANADPTVPDRTIAADALAASEQMTRARFLSSPASMVSLKNALDSSIMTLQQPAQQFSFPTLAQAYGLDPSSTSINGFTSKLAAAELMVLTGTNVVAIMETQDGWDTHGDSDGSTVRNQMNQDIVPPLATFLSRVMSLPNQNVVTCIIGEFSRSLPGSDHAPNLSATVIGKYVQNGTTGRVASDVTLPDGSPAIPQLWAYLAAAAHAPSAPFGPNPHGLVL